VSLLGLRVIGILNFKPTTYRRVSASLAFSHYAFKIALANLPEQVDATVFNVFATDDICQAALADEVAQLPLTFY